jgi:hypothetical protein
MTANPNRPENRPAQLAAIPAKPRKDQPMPCQCNPPLAMSTNPGHCGYCGSQLAPITRVERGPGDSWAVTELPPAPPTYDPTQTPDVHQLPAMMTHYTPEQFQQWLDTPGRLFIVYLPGRKSFVIKVPDEQHQFFADIMRQLRLTLGPEVQAQSAVSVPGADDA